MSDFLLLFHSDFLLHNALVGSVTVGLFCPLIGVYFYLRRAVLLGVALPQVSSAGVAFAFFLQGLGIHWSLHASESNDRFLALAGSLVFTLTVIFILAYLEKRHEGTTDSRLGAVYSMAFSAAILFVTQNPQGRTEFLSMLNGEIVSVTALDLHILIASFATVAIVLLMFNRQFLFVSFDRETALAMKKNVLVWDGLLYALIGLSISIGVLIVGPMLTFAFLVVPPLAARRFVRRMPGFFALSSLIGGLSGLVGFYMSYHWDWPLAPTDIAVACGALAISMTLKKFCDLAF